MDTGQSICASDGLWREGGGEGGREGIEVVLVTPKGSDWEGSGMGT